MSSASTMRSEPFMIRDLDIYRSANVIIREHGEDAALEAAMRADAMLEKGDIPMSAMGQKRTSRDISIYVRFRGLSGHPMSAFGGKADLLARP